MAVKKGTEIPTIDVVLVTIQAAGSSDELALDTASKIGVNPQVETEDAKKLIVKGKLIAQKPATSTITGNTIVLTDNVFNPELVKLLQGGTITFAKTYTYTASGSVTAEAKNFTVYGGYLNFTLPQALAASDKVVYHEDTGVLEVTKSGVTTAIDSAVAAVAVGTALTTVDVATTVAIAYAPPVIGSADKGSVCTLNAYSAVYNSAGLITKYEKISYPNCQGTPIALSSEDGAFRAPEYTINSAPATGQAPFTLTYVYDLPVVS